MKLDEDMGVRGSGHRQFARERNSYFTRRTATDIEAQGIVSDKNKLVIVVKFYHVYQFILCAGARSGGTVVWQIMYDIGLGPAGVKGKKP
jgi:hypothetical protein